MLQVRKAPIQLGSLDTSSYLQAFRSYERGDYEEALAIFTSINDPNDAVRLYHGLTCLALGRSGEAITMLSGLVEGGSQYQPAAQWYLTLAYLAGEQPDNARQQLNQILASTNHRYGDQARALHQRFSK